MNIQGYEIDSREQQYLESHLPSEIVQSYTESPLTQPPSTLQNGVTHLLIFVYSHITEDILEMFPDLTMIVTMSTGFDHIDLESCKKRNITVHNVPRYGDVTVAEHTFALILSLSRKIPESLDRTREHDFSPIGLEGFDLSGKTLGIIGMGKIGAHVAQIARGFGMNILAFDLFPQEELAQNLKFQYVSLEKLLSQSNIISLHTAYNQDTHHLINSDNIHIITKGSYLINTARGGLVETQALMTALDEGILAGVGLDVLEEECMIKEEKELLSKVYTQTCDMRIILQDHLLTQDPRVLVTPHNAFNSTEAIERILQTTVETLLASEQGNLINVIN